MWPIVRQARYLGRYRQIAQVLTLHGFGYLVDQIGLTQMLSLPGRLLHKHQHPIFGGPERLRMVLTELGPTFVKLGQLLSTRPDLVPPDFIHELNKLQDTVPPYDAAVAVAIIEEELGKPVDVLFAQFDLEPLAAASLGQVHLARLHDGSDVVVKVQRPDIQQVVAVDLAILTELAALAQERTALGQQYDLTELAWEFGAMLRAELDYRNEGRNADRFRQNFAGLDIVHVPTVHWAYTTQRVLTTERLVGAKINDLAALDALGINRKRLARRSVQLILQEVFTDGFFHADPHPGNFFALPGDVVGAVDFGQAVTLDRDMITNLLLLLVAVSQDDLQGALRAMQQLGMLTPRRQTAALQRDTRRLMDRLVDRSLEDISARETGEALLALAQRHHLRMPAPLALLLKAIIMMEGVGMQLDPALDVFAIARPYAVKAFRDIASPEAVGRRALKQTREFADLAGELPRQVVHVLQQLGDGELRIQTEDRETRRLAAALLTASARLALALVLAAFVMGVALLGIALGQGWQGSLPAVLLTLALVGAVVTGLALFGSLVWRSRE